MIVSGCQGAVDEPVVSAPVPTEAASSATTNVPVSVTRPDDTEAAEPSTTTIAASTTMPVAPTTTVSEVEDAVEPEADKSDDAEDGVAAESEPVTELPAEPPPLCHELEFDPADAADFQPVDLSYYSPLRASDENYEIVAATSPHPFYASEAAHDRDGYWRVRQEAYEPQTLIIDITDSAGRKVQHSLPLDPPEALPYPLHYAVIPEALIIGPTGWMFAASGITYLRIRELIPGDFDERGQSISYVSDWVWDQPSHETEGLYPTLLVDGGHDAFTCFVSFEDLGITQFDWYRYGTRSMKGYLSPDEYRGLFWHSEWDGTPVRSDLPEFSGACCKLFGLSTGYALTTSGVPGGYGPRAEWPPKLFYSSDGIQWLEIALPSNDLASEGDYRAWVCQVESSGAEVRILEGRDFSIDAWNPCNKTREWTADDDFGNWRLQEPGS